MPTNIEELRKPLILTFDTERYPIREALLSIIDDDYGSGILPTRDLSRIHSFLDHPFSRNCIDRSGNPISALQTAWNLNRDKQGETYKRDTQKKDTENYLKFENIYHLLLKDVIGPSIGGGRVLFQRAPTFRVYLPSTDTNIPMGKMHKDEDYHHQPSEINIWLPISDNVHGNNSLWVESEPNLGDFHPLNLDYGQIYRGYLNQCRHYTNVNDTDLTRVSIDFRLASEQTGGHDPSFHQGSRRGAKARFQKVFDIGGFYEDMVVDVCPL